jgi:hypothetical protein
MSPNSLPCLSTLDDPRRLFAYRLLYISKSPLVATLSGRHSSHRGSRGHGERPRPGSSGRNRCSSSGTAGELCRARQLSFTAAVGLTRKRRAWFGDICPIRLQYYSILVLFSNSLISPLCSHQTMWVMPVKLDLLLS